MIDWLSRYGPVMLWAMRNPRVAMQTLTIAYYMDRDAVVIRIPINDEGINARGSRDRN